MEEFIQYLKVGEVIANICFVLVLLYFLVPYLGVRFAKIINVEYFYVFKGVKEDIKEYKHLPTGDKFLRILAFLTIIPLGIWLAVIVFKLAIMLTYPLLFLGLLIHISILRQSKKLNNK